MNITKRLIEKHDGKLTVNSTVGVGSTFSFTLPIYQGEQKTPKLSPTIEMFNQEEVTATTTSRPASEQMDGEATILITDDDPINLQVLMNQLHLADYHVISASSGLEALEIVQETSIDLLILDVMMPQMSGYEVCQQLRQQYSLLDLPIFGKSPDINQVAITL